MCDRIIIGLGNPGPRYAGTRHNTGFRTVREIASRHELNTESRRFNAETVVCSIEGHQVLLMMPQVFVNNSGVSARAALDYYNISSDCMLVVTDDLNLQIGTIRLKRNGSAGGHNGLKSIIDMCGSKDFPRLKIGIGCDVIDDITEFVLGHFTPEEEENIEQAVHTASEAAATWVTAGIEQSMNRYN